MVRFRLVTDFELTIDLSPYICQQWSRITMKAGRYASLRDLLEQYTRTPKAIKQIVFYKKIRGWFCKKRIRHRIKALIRSTGYEGNIEVVNKGFLLRNHWFCFIYLDVSVEKHAGCGSFFFQT